MAQPLVIVWVQKGDFITVETHLKLEQLWVLARCPHPRFEFYCATCRHTLANIGNLEMHLEHGGEHHIAINCARHGYEAVINPPTLRLAPPVAETFL